MKRVHIHLFVKDLATSTGFYNDLFASTPTLAKDNYVRWELTDPAMNFAISNQGKPGIDHLGIQTEDSEKLHEMIKHFEGNKSSTKAVETPEETSCCYARSTKSWASDPQGIQWELYTTHHNEDEFFGQKTSSDCCTNSACSQ